MDILRKRFHIEPIAVTGPATDNEVGSVAIIRDSLMCRRSKRPRGGGARRRFDHTSRSATRRLARSIARRMNERCKLTRFQPSCWGGTGYVSGELLRTDHRPPPNFTLAGVMSDSSPGELAGKSFPHLAGSLADTGSSRRRKLPRSLRRKQLAVFCAAPHRRSGRADRNMLTAAEAAATSLVAGRHFSRLRFETGRRL